MGLPEEMIRRQPFPGPGLAIRVIGEVNKERLEILRAADVIVMEEMEKGHLLDRVWQSFAILLPVKTVGVMGDERSYENVIALRVVGSQDGMTADWVRLPYKILEEISNRIINEVKGVNRVVYDISSKPPSTIEWEYAMQHSDFIHLHVHSQYSLLDGAIRFDDVFELARTYRMPAVALTDHGNMFGVIEFSKAISVNQTHCGL
jgi:hypothetical protein